MFAALRVPEHWDPAGEEAEDPLPKEGVAALREPENPNPPDRTLAIQSRSSRLDIGDHGNSSTCRPRSQETNPKYPSG